MEQQGKSSCTCSFFFVALCARCFSFIFVLFPVDVAVVSYLVLLSSK